MATRKLHRLLSALAALLLGGWGHAAFQEMDGGARPASLGGAFTALADDADAPAWNPAGPARMKANEVGFMYSRPFSGLEGVRLDINSLSWVHPFHRGGALGLSVHSFEADDLYRERSVLVGYSHRLDLFLPKGWTKMPELYGGANVRYLWSGFTLDSRSAADPVFSGGHGQEAFSVDLGLLAQWDGLSVGFAAKNVNEPNMGFLEKDRVRAETRLGAAYRPPLSYLENSLIMMDLWFRDGEMEVHAGWESWFLDRKAALRLGWNDTAVAFGLGWRLSMMESWDAGIDYAYLIPLRLEEQGSGTHRVSLVARYGRRKN